MAPVKRLAPLLVPLLLFVSACAPPWTVVKPAEEGFLKGQQSFVLLAPSFDGQSPDPEHKAAISRAYPAALANEAKSLVLSQTGAAEDWTIRTLITRVEPGISMGLASTDSEIDARVEIVHEGEVVEAISVRGEANQDDAPTAGGIPLGGYGDTARLEDAAERLGRYVGRYLKKRTQ